LVAELGGPTMFARIGVMRALNRGRKKARFRARVGVRGAAEPCRPRITVVT